MTMQQCRRCGEVKPLDMFQQRSQDALRLSTCRSCIGQIQRDRRQTPRVELGYLPVPDVTRAGHLDAMRARLRAVRDGVQA
jgi:hypothetical protein